jgi:hypothetical protein
MKLIEHRWVHTLWCDDIRHEVGNKPSFMGVYNGELVMPTVPGVLPRLAAYITIGTPRDRPFKKLSIRMEKNDVAGNLGFMEFSAEQLQETAAQILAKPLDSNDLNDPDYAEPRGMAFNVVIQLGAIPVSETTKWLKVWVDTEDETLESFKLRFATPPQNA